MKWDFSTFRLASFQTILILYSLSIYLAIAGQLAVFLPSEKLGPYLLVIVSFSGLLLYAHFFMGWTIPRAWFITVTGLASLVAIHTFVKNKATLIFAHIGIAGMLVCAATIIGLIYADRHLAAAKLKTLKRDTLSEERKDHDL